MMVQSLSRFALSLLAAVSVSLSAGIALPAAAHAQSTWDQIEKSGVIRYGLIPNRPPYQWEKDGEQAGLAIDMGKDLAAALSKEMGREIKIEYAPSTWSTLVLDIQGNRIDAFFGMTETEERRKALDMFGPLYAVPVVAVTSGGSIPGEGWDDFNKARTRISVVMGTTDEDAVREFMPGAEIRAMKGMAEAILDVQSGNSEALVTSVLLGINAMDKNPNFDRMVLLKPTHALPSGGGTRRDGDGRFTAFVNDWAKEYRESGRVQEVILQSLKDAGFEVDAIPEDVRF